jgi:A/G-specific adenine glycosylase
MFPSSSAGLATLPGIGRSTAAAIAAFCFGERAAILDGNVKRVLTRALGFDADLAANAAARDARCGPRPRRCCRRGASRCYTQGLMDLGATLCSLARRPRCDACPLADGCVAHGQGAAAALPGEDTPLKRGQREHALLWLRSHERRPSPPPGPGNSGCHAPQRPRDG